MLSQAMAQRIELWKLAQLTPYPKNPRRHSDAQIAAIAGSIVVEIANGMVPLPDQMPEEFAAAVHRFLAAQPAWDRH